MTYRLGRASMVAVATILLAAGLLAAAPAPTTTPAPATAPRTTAPRPATLPRTPAGATAPSDNPVRAAAEVEALIQKAGATAPDWWNTAQLNYPKTLDLTWTEVKGPWDPQKNLGQYIWSVINENPGKWRDGAKLMHQVLVVNKDDPAKLARTMDALARIYHVLLQDWARAAFWYRKAAAIDPSYADNNALDLAHCYLKLGCKPMTVAIIDPMTSDNTRHGNLIKLWSEMGETQKALDLAEGMAKAGLPDIGYLAAGDACRLAGRYREAIDYYQKVLAATQGWRDIKQNKTRAQASIEAIRAAEGLDLSKVRDGAYTAASMGYAGLIEVQVTVQRGRITDLKVTKYSEKQYYSALTDTPAQILRKQGIKGVDAVTSATITSEAIMNATLKALVQGMK